MAVLTRFDGSVWHFKTDAELFAYAAGYNNEYRRLNWILSRVFQRDMLNPPIIIDAMSERQQEAYKLGVIDQWRCNGGAGILSGQALKDAANGRPRQLLPHEHPVLRFAHASAYEITKAICTKENLPETPQMVRERLLHLDRAEIN